MLVVDVFSVTVIAYREKKKPAAITREKKKNTKARRSGSKLSITGCKMKLFFDTKVASYHVEW